MRQWTRAVFLDRDGVLNRATLHNRRPIPPASLDELEILPGVAEALAGLREAGFLLVVVTNQPDVARGTQRREVVEAINERLCSALLLEGFFVSFEDGESPRRKPNPGLLLEAAEEHGIDLAASFMVGDRWTDVEAGRRAGCRTVFIDLDYDEPRPFPPADYTTDGLPSAASWIINESSFKEQAHGPS
jgi:D-glycero-D-manno-heptose 1,7-bisphosphate phosphatase